MMSTYEYEILIRQQLTEAQGRAARNHLARQALSQRPRRGIREGLARLFGRSSGPAPVLVPQMKSR
jgi:hypothetical protein